MKLQILNITICIAQGICSKVKNGRQAQKQQYDVMVNEAGCEKGAILLEGKTCINLDYDSNEAPNERTIVYHTIRHLDVLEVKELEKTMKLAIKVDQMAFVCLGVTYLIQRDN